MENVKFEKIFLSRTIVRTMRKIMFLTYPIFIKKDMLMQYLA